MPARIIPFINNQFYHVYNRGIEKRRIFENRKTYNRFLLAINYYQLEGPKPKFSNFTKYKLFKTDPDKKIVDLICYCLMPNHFHFLLRQIKEGGISEFISKLTNSYTKYFNIKFERVGPLLQGQFKAVLIESDEQLVHVSRYIHLNPISSSLAIKPEEYEWSSYNEFLNNNSKKLCKKEIVLDNFKSIIDYKKFVDDQIDYAQKLEQIKHQLLD